MALRRPVSARYAGVVRGLIRETRCKNPVPALGMNGTPITEELHWSRWARRSKRKDFTSHDSSLGSGVPESLRRKEGQRGGEQGRERCLDETGAAFARSSSISVVISSKTNNCRVSSGKPGNNMQFCDCRLEAFLFSHMSLKRQIELQMIIREGEKKISKHEVIIQFSEIIGCFPAETVHSNKPSLTVFFCFLIKVPRRPLFSHSHPWLPL